MMPTKRVATTGMIYTTKLPEYNSIIRSIGCRNRFLLSQLHRGYHFTSVRQQITQSKSDHFPRVGTRLLSSSSGDNGGAASSSRGAATTTAKIETNSASAPGTAATTTATSTHEATTAAAVAEGNLYQRTSNRGPVSWRSLFLVGVAAASAVAYYRVERERRLEQAMGKIVTSESDGWTPRPDFLAKRKFVPTSYGWFPVDDAFGAPGKPAIGGPWSAVDLDGNLVTNKSFEGKWVLLYFGFARCPDICPSEMMKVGKVMDTLKAENPELAKNIVPVFVSIDPARDSLKALKAYAKDFHPDYIFLTGSPTQIKDMAKMYRVYYSKAEESSDGDYLVDHSIVIYFHEDTGDLSDCFTQSMRPSDLVAKIKEQMAKKQQAVAA